MYPEISGTERIYASEREGVSRFPVENFLSHSIENFRWGTIWCIGKFRVSKNFVHQRGREYHISPSKTFCQTVTKNFVGEHFGVSEKIGYRKILCIREGGVYHISQSKTFVTQYQKMYVGEQFGESGIFRYREILCIREGGGITFLRRNIFVTQYQKISLGNSSVYPKNSDIGIFYASEREREREREGVIITFLRRKRFVSQFR